MNHKRDYLSYSALKAFEKSPNHYIDYVTQEKSEPSSAMKFGSAFHCMLLEPEQFAKRYAYGPKPNLRTKAGKEEMAAIEASGKVFLPNEDIEVINKMVSVIEGNSWASKLCFDMAKSYEKEVVGEIGGMKFKGFLDVEGDNYVVDVKTASDSSVSAFNKQASDLLYHLQAAIYTAITGKEFFWIVIESKSPHNCMVYSQSDQDYEMSYQYLIHLIERFNDWDGDYDYSGYQGLNSSPNIIDTSLPPWSKIARFASV